MYKLSVLDRPHCNLNSLTFQTFYTLTSSFESIHQLEFKVSFTYQINAHSYAEKMAISFRIKAHVFCKLCLKLAGKFDSKRCLKNVFSTINFDMFSCSAPTLSLSLIQIKKLKANKLKQTLDQDTNLCTHEFDIFRRGTLITHQQSNNIKTNISNGVKTMGSLFTMMRVNCTENNVTWALNDFERDACDDLISRNNLCMIPINEKITKDSTHPSRKSSFRNFLETI